MMEPSARTRTTARNEKASASLDLFINGILAGGKRWRMSKKIKTHRRTQEWIDAQAAACQRSPPEARATAALCGAAVRGADSATTSGGDARRSCRIEVRSVEQELPSRTSGA
jgi:hypothetical protein